jgi:hypothetical protein
VGAAIIDYLFRPEEREVTFFVTPRLFCLCRRGETDSRLAGKGEKHGSKRTRLSRQKGREKGEHCPEED